ncbi:MAG: hypothetical protein ACJ0BO_05775 [Candidatus Puniceispirillaceae bacterium]
MNWTKFKNTCFSLLICLQVIVIFNGNILDSGSRAVLLSSLISAALIAPIMINLVFKKADVLAVNSAFIVAFLMLMEGLFFFKIIEHPAIRTWQMSSKNKQSVEFLEKSPYIKFRPNVTVTSMGSRGNDFTYEWFTDELGFKNIVVNGIFKTHFDFIALGDSFTEGMGVKVTDTWTSKVGQKSDMVIYNAGVQGYSASQMRSTYESLLSKISHDGIIIGALPKIFEREETFANVALARKGTGGIQSIATGRYRQSFLTAMLRALKLALSAKHVDLMADQTHLGGYINEIPVTYATRGKLKKNQNWKSYIGHLTAISELALQNKKRVILIQYPLRHEIYFNVSQLGIKNISEIDYYVELDLIRDALPRNVEIIDMFQYIKGNWDKSGDHMYFLKDGHMNERGQELIADFLTQVLS